MEWTLHIGRFGPVVQRNRTCQSCGQPFACELSLGGCWCSTISLTEDTRSRLREKFSDCLCRECLTRLQREPSTSV
jgi:Cysteine-rich CWC